MFPHERAIRDLDCSLDTANIGKCPETCSIVTISYSLSLSRPNSLQISHKLPTASEGFAIRIFHLVDKTMEAASYLKYKM